MSTFDYIISRLDGIYSPAEARELAFWVLEETTGLSRAAISACKGTQNISNIEIILSRLQKKEPIQYIFGHTLWFGLDLLVTKDTLIPRPETAELVELVLNTIPSGDAGVSPAKKISVLDIGTGSGAIALALKSRRPDWQVTGLDISPAALAVAEQNARRNKLDVRFLQADIFSLNLKRSTLNVITSNPPYICESEKSSMESNVLDYEPSSALFVSDDDPLLFYRRIASFKAQYLFFEINSRFGAEVAQLMRDYGYSGVQIHNDIYGKQRMVSGRIES